jgi:thioredoxin reductase
VLVVGGGDSALEAAAGIAETPGAEVVLSYRGAAFDRAKPRNRERVAAAERGGSLRTLLGSHVRAIGPDSVSIECNGQMQQLPNDAVIVNAGGVLPGDFLRRVGIQTETKYGAA